MSLIAASNLVAATEPKVDAASVVSITPAATTTDSPTIYTTNSYDSPNAVTNGLGTAASEFSRTMTRTADGIAAATTSTVQAVGSAGRATGTAIAHAGSVFVGGVHTGAVFTGRCFTGVATFIGRGLTNSAVFMARAVSSGVTAIIKIPASIFGFMADTPVVSAAIKPTGGADAPAIDTALPRKVSATTVLPAAEPAAKTAAPKTPIQTEMAAIWPIAGDITTRFGVPHWPWQPTHTGIDISDGQPSGVTPVKPFKPGRVIGTVRSYSGLGNHVVVDHGGGMTSVYAHLSAISVSDGQEVDKTTTLGLEGSTGASTGTHLHFEIRLDGQPVNPLPYLNTSP